MGDNPARGFKVPKIRKEYKDGLREVDVNSRDAQEISHLLQRSYIESSYKSQWKLKTVHYVQNKDLEEQYRQKRVEMKDEGRNARDLTEQYGYMLLKDESLVPSVAKQGLRCRYLPFNALGNSRLGLYLSRNADVQLRLAEHWEQNTCKMLIFKMTPGKCKVLIGRQGNGEAIEPTPNYDCHVAQYQPRSCDPIHLQLARSQIYLYEYTEDCEPSERPRHCLPYAVLTYHKSPNYAPSVQPDSYSKRPAPDRSRPDSQLASDTDLPNRVESVNLADTRLRRREDRPTTTDVPFNSQDPRLAYIQQQTGDVGLCVPRLTPGPPPTYTRQGAPPGPVGQGNQGFVQNSSGYLPSFGPQFESNSVDVSQNQPSYPANQNLPFITNESLPNQNSSFPLNDPRLRRTDPRLDPRLRDPRLQKSDGNEKPTVEKTVREPYRQRSSHGDDVNRSKKKMSLNDYKQKVGIQPITRSESNQELPVTEDDVEDEMYDPSNPSNDSELPNVTQSTETECQDELADVDEHLDVNQCHEVAVDNPHDMKKALNELSDPDDGSQSPKTIADEVEEEDPILAAAMRKLVEHSGDVSLFTEALRRLQESAEEIGDKLHDPAFLVKAIAENVESLTKSKAMDKQTEQQNEKTQIQSSADSICGQVSMEAAIPPVTQNNPNVAECEESPMARAMKLTLEELQKSEVGVIAPPIDPFKVELNNVHSNKLKGSDAAHLASIPIPDYSSQKSKVLMNEPYVGPENMDIRAIPLPATKYELTEYSDVDIPKQNLPHKLPNPRTMGIVHSSHVKDENFQDKDERIISNTAFTSENTEPVDNSSAKDLKYLDKDYRIQKQDQYFGFPIDIPPSCKISENEVNFSKGPSGGSLEDRDERIAHSATSLIDRDERIKPPATSDSANHLLDTDERQLVHVDDKSRWISGMNLLDQDERVLKSNSQVSLDPDMMDRDERQSRNQSPTHISQVFLDVPDKCIQDKDERSQSRCSPPPQDIVDPDLRDYDSRFLSNKSPASQLSKVFMEIQDPSVLDRDERIMLSQPPSTVTQVCKDMRDQNSTDQDNSSKSHRQLPSKICSETNIIQDESIIDRDDRNSSCRSPSNISNVFLDIKTEEPVDLDVRPKSLCQSPSKGHDFINGQPISLTDRDDRYASAPGSPTSTIPASVDREDKNVIDELVKSSHSCSQSSLNVDQRPDIKTEIQEPLELLSHDNRIISRSSSPLPAAEGTSKTEVKIIPLDNLDGSENSSDSQGLFDAYSMGKETKTKKSSEPNESNVNVKQELDNEFGDVDWRLAAEAAEMGDVDLRSTKSGISQTDLRVSHPESAVNLRDTQQGLSQRDSQSRMLDGDMRTFGDLGDSQIQFSKGKPVASECSSSPLYTSSQSALNQVEGDVDLRCSDSEIHNLVPDMMGSQNPSHSIQAEYGGYHNLSSRQQSLYGGLQSFSQQPGGGYGTNVPGLECYTTYKAPIPSYSTSSYGGEYRSGSFQGRTYGDQYSYSTGGRGTGNHSYREGDQGDIDHYAKYNTYSNQMGPTQQPGPGGGLQNIMNKLDFSSLKNILAVVQSPAITGGSLPLSQVSESHKKQNEPRVDVDPEEENQPAFCTGLSFLRSKQPKVDLARAKYSGKAISRQEDRKCDGPGPGGLDRHPSMGEGHEPDMEKINEIEGHMISSTGKYPKLPGFDENLMELERPAGYIPGFGSSHSGGIPGLGMMEESEETSKPFTFSEDIPDRDISSLWYEETQGKDSSKKSDKDGKSKSPKKKSKRNRTESSGSEYSDNWQNAILESMEESALNVKSEDSFHTEGENDPEFKSPVLDVHKHDEGKRAIDSSDTEVEHKRHKPDLDSDDEDNGLVIDLDMSQMSKESTGLVTDIEPSQASKESETHDLTEDVITIDDSITEDDEVTKNIEGRNTPVLDEHPEEGEVQSDEEGNKKDEVELEEDAVGVPNTELKSFIEKKRKNIVIKLKGQTKKVNLKTGKAYTEDVVGSAIEVLGQPKKGSAQKTAQQIHPIRGIESLGKRSSSNTTQFQGSSISTLINRSSVPVAPPKPGNSQKSPPVNAYTHPYTGQKFVYPLNAMSQPSAVPSQYGGNQQPIATPSPKLNQYTGQPTLPRNNISLPTLPGQILVLPGQGRPTGVPSGGQQNFVMSVPTLGIPHQLGSPTLPPFERNQVVDGQNYGGLKTEKNYEFSRTNANKYIKIESDLGGLSTESNSRKRTGNENSSEGEVKKMKFESSVKDNVVKVLTEVRTDFDSHKAGVVPNKSNSVVKVLTDHGSEFEGQVEDKKERLSSLNEAESSTSGKQNEKCLGEDEGSELEDGEISDDDDDDDGIEMIMEKSHVSSSRRRDEGRRSRREYDGKGDYHRYSHYKHRGSDLSPERSTNRAASLWSDMLHRPGREHIEELPPNRANPRALPAADPNRSEDASSVLSKSAATFSKAKQKIHARTQMKTLGDWLKVELEIDNIEPLQNIIPYSLSTDLSIIPKPRRRKIRYKVKTAIEEEDNRLSMLESNSDERKHQLNIPNQSNTITVHSSKSSSTVKSNTLEVPHDQIERELKMVRDVMTAVKLRGPLRRVKPVLFKDKPLIPDSFEETKFSAALAIVELDMTALLSRNNYFGYPHRRVPQELLLESETNSFISEFGDVFLILMFPISIKAYNKLCQIKGDLNRLYIQKETCADKDAIEEEIKNLLLQRQNLLRAFTGYLNKKRITKLQEHADNFKMVYEFFKSQFPPYPDATLRFIKTTQKDLTQHLMISKQYLAMDGNKPP